MLNELATKYGTSKQRISFQGKNYLDVYEQYLSKDINNPINLLEIGILNGQSLKMWKEYFPNGNIYAIDINPECLQYKEDRININNCSQDDEKSLNEFLSNVSLDYIIDDGSHLVDLTLSSFRILFPKLKSGGLYIIEDAECFYYDDMSFTKSDWPGMIYNKDEAFINNRNKFNTFLIDMIKELDFKRGDIRSIHFYHQQIIIEKV